MSDRAMQVCETHLYAEKEQVCPWCRIRELVAKVERLEDFKQMAEMEFRKQVKRGDEWQQKAEKLEKENTAMKEWVWVPQEEAQKEKPE